MKNVIVKFLVIAGASLFFYCGTQKEKEAEIVDWTQMDDFHMLMAESFHPFKDSANIAPAIANAGALSEAAASWLEAPLPSKVDNETVRGYLENLKQTTSEFAQIAATSDTVQIQNALTKLHDDFHKIQEAWYNAGSSEGHDHEH